MSVVGLEDIGGVAGVEDAMEEQKRPARRWRMLERSWIKGTEGKRQEWNRFPGICSALYKTPEARNTSLDRY